MGRGAVQRPYEVKPHNVVSSTTLQVIRYYFLSDFALFGFRVFVLFSLAINSNVM